MKRGPDAESARQAEELATEIEELTAKRDAVEKRARELMAAEDFKAGVFYAQEIFSAKQEKLALDAAIDFARRRRNRLLMPL